MRHVAREKKGSYLEGGGRGGNWNRMRKSDHLDKLWVGGSSTAAVAKPVSD